MRGVGGYDRGPRTWSAMLAAEGTPEDVAGEVRSYTGAYLRTMLEKAREAAE